MSDPLRITAQGLDTILADSYDDAVRSVTSLLAGLDVDEIILGLPLRSDGSKGDMAVEVERFRDDLVATTGKRVVFVDERMSSLAASMELRRMGVKTGHRKGEVDQVAAMLLLQDYLSAGRPSGGAGSLDAGGG